MKVVPSIEEVRAFAAEGKYDVVPVSCEILSDFTTPIETIRMMNPQYLQGVAPAGRDNIICLPPGKAKLMRKFVPEAEEEKTTPEPTTKQ